MNRLIPRIPFIGCVCLALQFLIACKVGPNYKQPEIATPLKFSEALDQSTSPTLNLAQWWEAFDDPQLTSLIHRAEKANLDLKLAEARIREARAARREANSGFFPTIDTRDFYSRFRRSKNVGSGPTNRSSSSTGGSSGSGSTGTGSSGSSESSSTNTGFGDQLFQLGFDASWEVDVFGGVRRQVEAATGDIEAAIEFRNDALVTLLAEVGSNYIEARGTQKELSITEKNLHSQRESLEITRARFRAGVAGQLDVSRAEALAATTESQLPALQTNLAEAIHRLGILLGEEPAALNGELEEVRPVPVAREQVAVGLPAELLRRRPDIRRAERQLAAATARIGVATAELFPKFSLVGSMGLESSEFNDLFKGKSRFWSVGPSVSWPIFDAGRIRADIEIQSTRQEQAFITYEQTVLRALEETENALTRYANEQNRRSSIQRAVGANREASELSNELYTKGLTDFLTVLDAERALLVTETALTRSETVISAELIALYKALGGGWEVKDEVRSTKSEERKDGREEKVVEAHKNPSSHPSRSVSVD